MPFLYVVEVVCLVLHVWVVNIIVFFYGLLSDLFVCLWLGLTWFSDTVCACTTILFNFELNQN